MNFLLDTNVVSEWVKPAPNPGVIAWLAEADEDRVFLSVVTIVELRYGIEKLFPGARSKRLAQWLEQEIPIRFEGRILDVDPFTADVCGKLIAGSESIGRRMDIMDAFIAAAAQVHKCTVVTRNASQFDSVTTNIVSPWL